MSGHLEGIPRAAERRGIAQVEVVEVLDAHAAGSALAGTSMSTLVAMIKRSQGSRLVRPEFSLTVASRVAASDCQKVHGTPSSGQSGPRLALCLITL